MKVRVAATIDKNLSEELRRVHFLEIEHAKSEDRTEPDWSNTVEMVLRKGVRSYGKDKTRA